MQQGGVGNFDSIPIKIKMQNSQPASTFVDSKEFSKQKNYLFYDNNSNNSYDSHFASTPKGQYQELKNFKLSNLETFSKRSSTVSTKNNNQFFYNISVIHESGTIPDEKEEEMLEF